MVVSVPGMSAPLFNQQSMPGMPAPPSNRQPIPGMPAPPSSQPAIPRTSHKAPPIHREKQSQWTVMKKKSEARSDMGPKVKVIKRRPALAPTSTGRIRKRSVHSIFIGTESTNC